MKLSKHAQGCECELGEAKKPFKITVLYCDRTAGTLRSSFPYPSWNCSFKNPHATDRVFKTVLHSSASLMYVTGKKGWPT